MTLERSEARERGGDQLRSLTRAIGLLRILAVRDGAPARLGHLVRASGMHKATVHRLLSALVREGLVEHDAEGYTLGPALAALGDVAARRFDIRAAAMPVLQRIALRTGDVALLFVRSGGAAVCVARCEGEAPIIPGTTRVGTVKPLGVGAGSLALLAAISPDEAEAIIAGGEAERIRGHPRLSAAFVRGEVEATRRRGFALDDQLSTPDVTALGVPILDGRGRPVAALSYTAFSSRLPPGAQPAMAAKLVEEARSIMRRATERASGRRPAR